MSILEGSGAANLFLIGLIAFVVLVFYAGFSIGRSKGDR